MGQVVAAELRERVYRANQELAESGLVHGTFGNVSGCSSCPSKRRLT